MREKINEYIKMWELRGYPNGIPDEVPDVLMNERLAPSYKAICYAILKNDHVMKSLGYSEKPCDAYIAIKRMEKQQAKPEQSGMF